MKTKFYFFLWVCLSALLVACEHEESDTSFKGTRTILAYIAADNTLSLIHIYALILQSSCSL